MRPHQLTKFYLSRKKSYLWVLWRIEIYRILSINPNILHDVNILRDECGWSQCSFDFNHTWIKINHSRITKFLNRILLKKLAFLSVSFNHLHSKSINLQRTKSPSPNGSEFGKVCKQFRTMCVWHTFII